MAYDSDHQVTAGCGDICRGQAEEENSDIYENTTRIPKTVEIENRMNKTANRTKLKKQTKNSKARVRLLEARRIPQVYAPRAYRAGWGNSFQIQSSRYEKEKQFSWF